MTVRQRVAAACWECRRHAQALHHALDHWPMRDRLDRLERLGFVDTLQWLEWRAVRNRLAPEYPDAPELRWAALGAALQAARALLDCVDAWLARLEPSAVPGP